MHVRRLTTPTVLIAAVAIAVALVPIGVTAALRPDAGRPGAAPASHRGHCDRHCLLAVTTRYTEALIADDPSQAPAARDIRVTSNGDVTTLGDGEVWGVATRLQFRKTFVDPSTGQVVFYGTATNTPTDGAKKWFFYTLRLRVVDRLINEVEEISWDEEFEAPASSLDFPDRIFDSVLPPEERSSRGQRGVVIGIARFGDAPGIPNSGSVVVEAFKVEDGMIRQIFAFFRGGQKESGWPDTPPRSMLRGSEPDKTTPTT
ncbi:MAG: hypothetical protein GEV03_04130 [Streptosporangiales bacterium]|nr:hypothetical protein [Streptosporangiales bacterium]